MIKNWRIWANGTIVVLLMAAVLRGNILENRYQKSVQAQKDAIAAANLAAREKEQKMNFEMAQARKEYENELQKQADAYAALRTDADRLRSIIATRTAANPATAARNDAGNQACWVVLSESIAEYEALASEADELNSRLSIAKKWARVVAD